MNYMFSLSKVNALLSKLVAALAASAVVRASDVELFDSACSDLFAFRMAPNHALRIRCIEVLAQAEAAIVKQAAAKALFLEQKNAALKAHESREAARLIRRELWNAGKAEADRKAAERKAKVPAKVAKGSWRAVKGTAFSPSDLASLEAEMLAPRGE